MQRSFYDQPCNKKTNTHAALGGLEDNGINEMALFHYHNKRPYNYRCNVRYVCMPKKIINTWENYHIRDDMMLDKTNVGIVKR